MKNRIDGPLLMISIFIIFIVSINLFSYIHWANGPEIKELIILPFLFRRANQVNYSKFNGILFLRERES